MLEILAVEPGSIAAELELESGDCILAINGHPVRDLLDFQLYIHVEELLLEVQKKDGELWELDIEKDAPDSLGMQLPHPEPTQCGNNCIFCFVHQLPSGMRHTLYVKDEDFRFSYLYGSYVTLTNIGEAEIQRILEQKLSPLYVSVHTTDDQLRTEMLGRKGPAILDLLRQLTAGGIEVHTQIVLCPGINDGAQLEKTMEDLFSLYPGVASLAVVPVGLTGYRERLPELRTPNADETLQVIETIHAYQKTFLEKAGTRFVFAADELYLKAGIEFPPIGAYEDLAQIENGVGFIPQFREEAEEALLEARPLGLPEVSTFTGESAKGELRRFVDRLSSRVEATIHLHPVQNRFFGGQVSVTGLITGRDVVEQLRGKPLGQMLLVPDVVLKEGEDVFLDDLSLEELGKELSVAVRKIASTPWGLLDALEDMAE